MTDATLNAPLGTTSFTTGMSVRKRMTPQDARRRSLRVKLVRFVFIGGAVAAILALVGNVALRLVQTVSLPASAVVQGENLVIEKPRFVGAAKDGSKIIVTAEKASRAMSSQNGAVQLELPVMETSDGSKATAKTGIWSQADQTLSLDGDVVLNRPGGDRATSSKASWTSEPARLLLTGGVVLARANGDQATSDSASWTNVPSQLIVTGNVSLTRAGGARATAVTAIWRKDIGSLDLTGGTNIMLPTGESASALDARLDDRLGNIALNGQAVIRFAGGQANSQTAFYQGLTGQISGEGGIQITSSLGTGSADRYVYGTRSKRLDLKGNARATLR